MLLQTGTAAACRRQCAGKPAHLCDHLALIKHACMQTFVIHLLRAYRWELGPGQVPLALSNMGNLIPAKVRAAQIASEVWDQEHSQRTTEEAPAEHGAYCRGCTCTSSRAHEPLGSNLRWLAGCSVRVPAPGQS